MSTRHDYPQWEGSDYATWSHSQLLTHEIGHCLGLRHTFNENFPSSYIDDIYLPDDNKSWASCNSTDISNNILGYNTCRDYLSPLQIADARRIINNINGLRKIKNTIIELHQSTGHNVVITEPNTVWERYEIIGDSLIIEPGASLIVRCKVHFSPDARVIIKQGGKMIIDGGILTNEHGKYWHGVQVYGDFYQHQYPAHNPTYQGMLVLQNGGTIEYAYTAAMNWKHNSWWERGGVIQSNGGIFRNNQINPSSFNKIPHITIFYKTQRMLNI